MIKKEEEDEMLFYMPRSLKQELRILAIREGKSLKDIMNEITKEYVKVHGDGNPAYTLDQFVEEPGMKAVPAFFRNRDDWQTYIEKLPEKESQELLWQAQTIKSLADKKVNYDTTQVRVH